MQSIASVSNHIFLKIAFFTQKSARQTTPSLFRNGKLSSRGFLATKPRQYAHNLPADLVNRHLYWDRTLQNKKRAKVYNANRLYKLGIRPIHQEGERKFQRELVEILYELSDLKLLKKSLGRSLQNLREIFTRFPETMESSEGKVVLFALKQIHDRNLASMNLYEFCTFCQVSHMAKVKPSENLITHFYKFIEAESLEKKDRFKLFPFLALIKYFFDNRTYSEDIQKMLNRQHQEFKLFEDTNPINKSLEEMLPLIFSDEKIKEFKKAENYSKMPLIRLTKYNVPGGKELLNRFQIV